MTREEQENAIRCLKIWIEREPYIQTYKTCLEALEQEPKTGHWIITYPHGKQNPIYECPRCHASNSSAFKNFCPNCGLKMVEPQERSVKE